MFSCWVFFFPLHPMIIISIVIWIIISQSSHWDPWFCGCHSTCTTRQKALEIVAMLWNSTWVIAMVFWDSMFKAYLVYNSVDLGGWARISVLYTNAVFSCLSKTLKLFVPRRSRNRVCLAPWGPSLLLSRKVNTDSRYSTAMFGDYHVVLHFLVEYTSLLSFLVIYSCSPPISLL